MSLTAIPRQLNYKAVNTVTPEYVYTQIPLSNLVGPNIDITSAGQTLEFRPQSGVVNLSKSFIGGQLNILTANITTNNYAWIPQDTVPFVSQLQVGSSAGPYLVDMSYVSNHMKVARKMATSIEEYCDNDVQSKLYPSNKTASTNYRLESVAPVGSAAQTDPYFLVTNTTATFAGINNYSEERHALISAQSTGVIDPFMIPLSAFKDTILELDVDIPITTDFMIRIVTNTKDKIAIQSASATDPSSSVASLVTGLSIQQLYLYVAYEQNPVIVDSVMAKLNSGSFKLTIPYLMCYMNSLGSSAGANSVQVSFNNSYGKRLKHVTTMVFHANENAGSTNVMYDCTNYAGNKIKNYRTLLNNRYLQNNTLYCLMRGTSQSVDSGVQGRDDWRENQKFCKDSCLVNAGAYQLNWFHRDSWAGRKDELDGGSSVNLSNGLELEPNQQYQWAIQCTTDTNGASAHLYTFVCFEREILLNKLGYSFV